MERETMTQTREKNVALAIKESAYNFIEWKKIYVYVLFEPVIKPIKN